MPFFKQLHKIGDKAGEYSNKALEKASYILNKVAGGPGPFKFVTIGILVGLVIGLQAEHAIHHGVEHIIEKLGEKGAIAAIAVAIRALGVIVSLAFKIATGLWYYGTANALVGVLKKEFSDPEEAIEANKDAASKLEDEAGKEDDEKKEEK